MTDRPSAPEILKQWGRMPVSVEDSEDERRGRVVSNIARAIRQTAADRERARRRRVVYTVLAAAAVIALTVTGLFGARSIDRKPVAGDNVSTPGGAGARLVFASGVEVEVAAGSRAHVARASDSEEVLELDLGAVSVHAPPLGARSFAVHTPDARVVVHGTRFSVKVENAASGTTTSVEVTEGTVAVLRDGARTLLTPGMSWSSKAATETSAASPSQGPSAPLPDETGKSADKLARKSPASPAAQPKLAATDPSALAEQNKLFAAAVAARQRGDDRAALGQLNQLLGRYPTSPLAPEARVERFRALKRLGRDAEAASEARRYLVEQRDGAAGDEARDIALPKK